MEENNRDYKNDDITVHWKPKQCIHSTLCYTKLREVFDPRKRPWVNMHGSTTEKIIDIVKKCPTDALTFTWNDEEKRKAFEENQGTEAPAETKPVKINLMKNGPIVASGDFKILDEDGKEFKSMKMVSFCRCRESNSMPYCDGTHRKIGFETKE